jgi:DNA (cytosine-5)-methyltransferase 1
MLRIVDEVRPAFVFAENSPQLRTKGLATIVERFISMGYVGRVGVLGAGDIGANHERKRMWIVAVAKGIGCGQGWPRRPPASVERQQQLPFQITDAAESKGQQVGIGGQPRGHLSMGVAGGNVAHSDCVRGLQSQGRVFEIGQWFGHCAEQPSNAKSVRKDGLPRGKTAPRAKPGHNVEYADWSGITDWWSVPRFAGVDDGMADRLDRVKATGNGQAPGVAALAWSILTSDLKKDSTRLTDEPVNSGSCNDGELGAKCDQS